MISKLLHPRACIFEGDSKNIGDVLQTNTVDALVCDPPAGIGFMGKGWDQDHGGRDAWIAKIADILRPAFDVLKPGAHGLVWALPRTSHWTAFALELAGYEIRDRVSHFFGSGFPKSLDVSKAIDAHFGVERAPGVPRGGACGVFAHSGNGREQDPHAYQATTTEPATAEAKVWEGWGTALKPACEDWWLVRKPFPGTVAGNVLKHGTGALNIDGCRIAYDADGAPAPVWGGRKGLENGQVYGSSADYLSRVSPIGRWPAHVIFDEDAAVELDAQHEGASRFFYVAKAPRSEKDAGLAHLPQRSGGEATDRVDGSAGLSNPRAGAGRTGGARNTHPTVKSVTLMRYLLRLVTPPGGTVLDPFFGSGTTGVAALEEGFSIVGIEADPEYIPINTGRIAYALKALP